MFTSNDTQAQEFVYARKVGATINLDAYEHIEFLKMLLGSQKRSACVTIQVGSSRWERTLWTIQKNLNLG